jgi:hypothetical protein
LAQALLVQVLFSPDAPHCAKMVDFGEMTRKKVFEDTAWLFYCLCSGEGLGAISPLVMGDQKQLCCHSQSSTTDIVGEQGLCHTAETCICLTSHCALPPAKGTPTCVICNKRFGTEKRDSGSELKSELFDIETLIDKPFWCIYCFCFGNGINAPGAAGPFFAVQFKEFCCQGMEMLESPVVDGVCCSQLGTFLCCWNECSLPPAAGNPKCAICTWKLNKDHSEADDKPPGKPQQMPM